MYMLDTDICIYLIKGKPESLMHKLESFIHEELALSVITAAELERGMQKSRYPEKSKLALMKYLSPFSILPFDFNAAKFFGTTSKELEAKGTMIGPYDSLIAAHALSVGATLVTNNTKEFERVPGLMVENWAM